MNEQDLRVLRILENSMAPKKAQAVADIANTAIEAVYHSLVRMYDLGLVRIAREPVTGVVAGWEAA